MGKIGPFVGKDETIGPVVRIDPFVGIGLFGGTGPVVSLTHVLHALSTMQNIFRLTFASGLSVLCVDIGSLISRI